MIGRLLGHSRVQTTARYAHLARDSVHEAARRVSDRIEASLYRDCPGPDERQRDSRGRVPAGPSRIARSTGQRRFGVHFECKRRDSAARSPLYPLSERTKLA